jgi:hypothetical protein
MKYNITDTGRNSIGAKRSIIVLGIYEGVTDGETAQGGCSKERNWWCVINP